MARRASATSTPPLSAEPELVAALLAELAREPDGISLPRLCKRMGLRMSALLRALAWLGDETIGGHRGPGWVRTREDGARTLALLTEAGRAALQSAAGSDPAPP